MNPFDYVQWTRAGELPQRLTVEEFVAVPLVKRVKALLSEELQFFCDDEVLPAKVALTRLAKTTAASTHRAAAR